MAGRNVDVLILGAGIAGLLLARELRGRGLNVRLAHDPTRPGASEAAVGLLNPVRGPRSTIAWRASETFAAAREVYAAIGRDTGTALLRPVPVLRAFASKEERAAFELRADAIAQAGFACSMPTTLPPGWQDAGHGVVSIHGGGAVDVVRLLAALKAEARAAGVLVDRRCRPAEVAADRLVHTGGIDDLEQASAIPLPLRAVRGESLLVHITALDPGLAFVCGHHLAPLGAGLWACGGTKVPGDASREPTPAGRAELEGFLARHLTVPWQVVGHRCGVRAATLDARPLAGRLTPDGRILVFNGFGSQGYAVAPWLARVFADHLTANAPLPAEVDPLRFAPQPAGPSAGKRWHAVDVARAITLAALAPGDLAIDLTCGNGGDTVALAAAVGPEGAVLAIDIQTAAIEATHRRLQRERCETPVDLRCADHAHLPSLVAPAWHGRVGAVVANLGYLPGSTSPLITRPGTTLAAFSAGLALLRRGGVLVAVIYLQHEGGGAELAAIEHWAQTVDANSFDVAWQRAPDRAARAPVVFSVRRR